MMSNVKLKDIDISLLSSKHNQTFRNLEEYDKGNYRPTYDLTKIKEQSAIETTSTSKVLKKND